MNVCKKCGRDVKSRSECATCRVTSHRQRKAKQIRILFGGRCIRCGYDRCFQALEFHHRDPKTKDKSVKLSSGSASMRRMVEEAEKCDLLCANCHREIHNLCPGSSNE